MKNNISFENLELLFEDENIVAVNKPEGLASIHDSAGEVADLQSILNEHYKTKIFVVHRLDKEVSGVILYAKNEKTHKFMNTQFAEQIVKKSYTALVHGIVEKEEGEIKFPIREFGSGRMGIDKAKGKPCKTFFSRNEKIKSYTLLELNPTTLRRHQLRVHLYAIGHPIVGDVRYGEKEMQEKFPRLMLHAKSVCFSLPDKPEIKIEAPLAATFTSFINDLKNNS